MKKPKILISITRRYIMESYFEYLIRYLGSEYIIDQAYTPYPPYEIFRDDPLEIGNIPTMRDPDEYDLILPHFPTHWNVYGDEHWGKDRSYANKIGLILWDGISGREKEVATVGVTNPIIEKQLKKESINYFPIKMGIDFDLFKPLEIARDDEEFRIGIVGHYLQPRRMMKQIFNKIRNIPGVKFMVFPTQWEQLKDYHESREIFQKDYSCIYPGDKWLSGLPNIYNSFDVLLRMDEGIDYALPVMEAAACGIPSICTDGGMVNRMAEERACYLIKAENYNEFNYHNQWYSSHIDETIEKIRVGIEYMRDHKEERLSMGRNALNYVKNNYLWENQLEGWRNFLNEGLSNVKKLN